jgi:predicted dehydrogenase
MRFPLNEVVWGSIGCGDVMEVKSGPALQNVPHSRLYAVMRRDGALARDFAARHGVPAWYDSADALIHDPEVNAIYIATPPDSHLEYTTAAAPSGKPIYVEKPMANSYRETLEMIEVCKLHDTPLFVAYYRRSLPAYLKVKEILKRGHLGKITQVEMQLMHLPKAQDMKGEFNWRVVPEVAGCGYFCDLASHMLDLIQFLVGDIQTARGSTANTGGYYGAEDFVEATFATKSGIQGHGLWDFNASEARDRTQIIGEKGHISYSHFAEAPVIVNLEGKSQQFDLPHPRHIQRPLIQLIVDELRGGSKSPSSGTTASRTNWVMDQILGRI